MMSEILVNGYIKPCSETVTYILSVYERYIITGFCDSWIHDFESSTTTYTRIHAPNPGVILTVGSS
jgi:hypothetical protein